MRVVRGLGSVRRGGAGPGRTRRAEAEGVGALRRCGRPKDVLDRDAAGQTARDGNSLRHSLPHRVAQGLGAASRVGIRDVCDGGSASSSSSTAILYGDSSSGVASCACRVAGSGDAAGGSEGELSARRGQRGGAAKVENV